ncbi:hypothetical protein [Methanococcoides sp. NM1]|uniref:hypothetical protein n=1 Tax=Methanococcoides sp. NM1 TaxID=1201013 RepID=UPI0010843052|nr:hypothetical protein [Methanococcoides sp. NM1]
MKKMIIISFLLLIFLANPVSADLFSDMNQKVVTYNQNVDKVPSFVNSLLGNEEIYGIIELNDGSALELKVVTEDATVVEFQKLAIEIEAEKGDCNQDGYLSAVDSLCALNMATGKMAEDANVDVDNSGAVTSLDARIILQSVVGLSSEVDPTVVVISNEDTIRSIMESQQPADKFLDAYDAGDIVIEPVGVVNNITFFMADLALKISKLLGIL